MNYFTKKELCNIYHACAQIALGGSCNLSPEFFQKVQFLIDNYCEHNDQVSSSDENGHLIVQCGRCDLVFWHEKD